MVFDSASTAGNATLIVEDGSVNDAEGGTVFFYDQTSGGTARLELSGNGKLDLSLHEKSGMTIGSIEGNGSIFLGSAE